MPARIYDDPYANRRSEVEAMKSYSDAIAGRFQIISYKFYGLNIYSYYSSLYCWQIPSCYLVLGVALLSKCTDEPLHFCPITVSSSTNQIQMFVVGLGLTTANTNNVGAV